MKPHPNNFCGGNYQDWMEVMLTAECNGKCSWCIEKEGFHPRWHIGGKELARIINDDPRPNVLLLGGEPTLYNDLEELNQYLQNKNLYITTNGSHLLNIFNMKLLKGVNISIHHYDLERNTKITGCRLVNSLQLIAPLKKKGIQIRFNCNLIKGEIDSKEAILQYIEFAKQYHVDSVRFAELKNVDHEFVDLAEIMDHEYGLNDDPYIHGCNQDVIINGMHVNFRQMCGLQTPLRPKPTYPEQYSKSVLYYNGQYYQGWQKAMNMRKLLEMVLEQQITINEAMTLLADDEQKEMQKRLQRIPDNNQNGGGCTY